MKKLSIYYFNLLNRITRLKVRSAFITDNIFELVKEIKLFKSFYMKKE